MGLRQRLSAGPPLLLDAATGTELTRRGADTRAPLWSARALLEAPELLAEIHRENAAAGADVLTAATFRTHRRNLAKEWLGARARELNDRALALAREGARRAGRAALVAGSLAPLEDCYRPDLVPEDAVLAEEHAEQAGHLLAGGADLILVETMNCGRELLTATRAALATGLPVIACAVTDGEGRLLSGEPIGEATPDGVAALGVNCVPARFLAHELARLAAAAPGVALAAYGNLGRPLDETDTDFSEPLEPAAYAELARGWLALGARIVGGCCGTGAVHTRALRAMLDGP